MKNLIGILVAACIIAGCSGAKGQRGESTQAAADTATTRFAADADSLFKYVSDQVELGPRVPGSDAHRLCGDLILNRLKASGIDSVAVQLAEVETFKGDRHMARNIMGCLSLIHI